MKTNLTTETLKPAVWKQLLPWLLLVTALGGAGWLVQQLAARVQPNVAFGMVRIEHGWWYALLYGLAALVVIGLTSGVGLWMAKRAGKRGVSYWTIVTHQISHLLIWAVIMVAVYPIIYVLAASFDARNTLFNIAPNPSQWLLLKAKILPNFSAFSLENYQKLFDGVHILWYQWLSMAIGLLSMVGMAVAAAWLRQDNHNRQALQLGRWSLWALVFSIASVVITLNSTQFTGQGNESKFLLHIRNTFLVSGLTGVLAILLSTTAGYAMARLSFPGRFQMLLFFIFIQMFPGFLSLVAIFYLLNQLGLLNTFSGLILAYSSGAIAFNTWIYKGYVESLPASLEEAALVDGANRWQTFMLIVLPLSAPILAFIFLNQFIGTYAEFILSSITLTGVEHWTVGVSLRSFTSGQFATKWGIFAAASMVGALPIVALFYGFQNYFVSGAAAGGVKE